MALTRLEPDPGKGPMRQKRKEGSGALVKGFHACERDIETCNLPGFIHVDVRPRTVAPVIL